MVCVSPKDSLDETLTTKRFETRKGRPNPRFSFYPERETRNGQTVQLQPLSTQHETRDEKDWQKLSPCAAAAGQKHADATYIGRPLLGEAKWCGYRLMNPALPDLERASPGMQIRHYTAGDRRFAGRLGWVLISAVVIVRWW